MSERRIEHASTVQLNRWATSDNFMLSAAACEALAVKEENAQLIEALEALTAAVFGIVVGSDVETAAAYPALLTADANARALLARVKGAES